MFFLNFAILYQPFLAFPKSLLFLFRLEDFCPFFAKKASQPTAGSNGMWPTAACEARRGWPGVTARTKPRLAH